METLVDPTISQTKFEREIALYRNVEQRYCERGWFLAKAEFPEAFVVFTCPKVRPALVFLGVLLDFTNYDLWPPSVRFVNPFTRVPYKYSELPTKMERNIGIIQGPHGELIRSQGLIQHGYSDEALPFLCFPG